MENWRARAYGAYVSSGQSKPIAQRNPWLAHFVKAHFPEDKNAVVVDLGCGHGDLLAEAGLLGFKNLIGVEYSDEMLAEATRNGRGYVQKGDLVEWLKTTAPASCDVLVVKDVLEHFDRAQLFDILDGIRAVLRPGGRIIGHVPNADGLWGSSIRWADITHELSFNPVSLQQVLSVTGFERVECFEDEIVAHGLKSFLRKAVWVIGTFQFRMLSKAENPTHSTILTRNLTFVAFRGSA